MVRTFASALILVGFVLPAELLTGAPSAERVTCCQKHKLCCARGYKCCRVKFPKCYALGYACCDEHPAPCCNPK